MKSMVDVVLVLGMHRSGTSAVAGTMSKLGGALPRHLMSAHPINSRGFFESVAFMHFHDELLASAGTEWNDWRLFNPGWIKSPSAADFRLRAKRLFAEEFDDSPLLILKDPRMCRIMPFWLEVLQEMSATPYVAMPIRSPLDVAQSLRQAYGFSLTHGMLLWLRHVLDAEAQTRAVPRSIFTWKDFQSDWRATCLKILSDTHLSWPRLSDRSAREVDGFLARELVHFDTDHALFVGHSEVNEWTRCAYEALLELARDPRVNSARTVLDDIKEIFDKSSNIFGRFLIDSEVELQGLRGELQSAGNDRDVLRARQAEIQAEQAAILSGLEARVAVAETARIETEHDRERLAQIASAVQAERDDMAAVQANITAELQSHRQELAEKAAALIELGGRAEAAQKERDDARRDREELVRSLTLAQAERDEMAAVQANITAELQSHRQDLAKKTAALIELGGRAEAAQKERDDARRDREELVRSLTQAQAERDGMAAVQANITAELQLRRKEAEHGASALAELASRLESAEAAREELSQKNITLVAAEEAWASQLQTLRDQLVDTEAALAALTARRTRKGVVGRLAPAALHRIYVARLLLRSGLFDAEFYRKQFSARLFELPPKAAKSEHAAAEHYIKVGFSQGYCPNPLFDTRWYLDRNEDVRRSGMNPLLHYCLYGFREKRDPGPRFQAEYYLHANPDVEAAGMNPLAHYLRHGRMEGRLAVRPT